MKLVLTGLPFTGKSTVFRALVGKKTQAKTSAAGKIQKNIGTLEIKDKRLEELAGVLNSEKITYPQISLVDLTVTGETKSKGIEAAQIREFDGLVLTIGAFVSQDAVKDLQDIESELILADIQLIQNRIERIKKEKKAHPKKEEDPELVLLNRLSKALEDENFVRDLSLSREELKVLAGFQLLTLKPTIVVANISEEQIDKAENRGLQEKAKEKNFGFLAFCAKLELEIEELPDEERPQFLQEMGLTGLSRDKFIKLCFQTFDLISFFTVVGKEARAWTIYKGTTAQEAAGCVHSDMERGFIRAEVINYKDFVTCGSFAKAKEKGLLRLESKEYPVQDGDIINFKFSV